MLTVGSLFSGIGGFDLGLERAGMRVLWQCESDPFCRRVLAEHWPGVPCYEDVRELRGVGVRPVDVLCGGFPCQDISGAGKRAGIDGDRSGLWSEFARLIGEFRPEYVIVENVADLLVRGVGRVLGDLAALRYDAEWDCLPASAVGAPHQRDRVWIIAYPRRQWPVADSGGQCGAVGREARDLAGAARGDQGAGEERQRDGDAPRDRRSIVADAASNGCGSRWPGRSDTGGAREQQPAFQDAQGERRRAQRPQCAVEARTDVDLASAGGQWLVEPDVGRVADGVPARVDRLRSLGNALVPQIAQWIGERIVSYEASRFAASGEGR